jgi:serine/threonine protein kinase
MFKIGDKVEGYEILELLGESPLAISYRAEKSGHETIVLKIMKDELFTGEEWFNQLLRPREAITQGKLSNQAYLSFYKKVATAEFPDIGKRSYLVRDHVIGQNLTEWMKQPREWPEIKNILRRICLGLDHLHQAKLVHGGLCPEDIIIGDGIVKVTDFGTSTGFLSSLFSVGEIPLERRSFIPPWHSEPEKLKSQLTDIYALGVILYLLQKGIVHDGLPEDASLPVKMAIEGKYKSVEDFLRGIEDLEEEQQMEEEGEQGEKEELDKGGEWEDEEKREEELDYSRPEPEPKIEIRSEDLTETPSGFTYHLQRNIKGKHDRVPLVVRNLQDDGQGIIVQINIVSGSDWIQAEATEVKVPPGEKKVYINLGPVKSNTAKSGKIVLEISFEEGGVTINREILIRAEFCCGFGSRILENIKSFVAYLIKSLSAISSIRKWPGSVFRFFVSWKWVVIPSALILGVFLLSMTNPLVFRETEERDKDLLTGDDPEVYPPPPSDDDITVSLEHIESNLLGRGDYSNAASVLEDLKQLHPENRYVADLLGKIENELYVELELVLPPGYVGDQGGMIRIHSGDGFRLRITPDELCYIYVYQFDSYDNVVCLFPSTDTSMEGNPLQGSTTYQIPEDNKYYILDHSVGQETIYFVASRWPAGDLEETWAKISDVSKLEEVSQPVELEQYHQELLKRLESRASVFEEGLEGCFYKEYTFMHEESTSED